MRRLISTLVSCVSFLILVTLAPARQDDATKALVAKAIKAHGGADKLNKAEASHVKMTGTLEAMGGIKFSSEAFTQPGKFRILIDTNVNNMNINIVQVYDGKTLWVNTMGMTIELKDPEILKGIEENKHSERIGRIVGLLDKGVELSPLGDIKVNGKDAIGVRASSKGHKDVNLYFDKKTNLLAKSEARAFDPLTKKEVTQESFLSDYHDVDGIQMPQRMVINQDGKRYLSLEITSTRFVERHDDSMFAKP
jgi:hypothetical protein